MNGELDPLPLQARLVQVLARLATSTQAAGRPIGSVRLIGVTKTRTPNELVDIARLGLRDLGANYLEETMPGIAAIKASGHVCSWHFIGQIQGNKTRLIAQHFDWVHTVDRMRIAERLSAQRAPGGEPLNVLIQVNFAHESSKGGVQSLDALRELAAQVRCLPNLRLRGLMTIPPARAADPHAAFAEVAAALTVLREDARAADALRGDVCSAELDTLSMGMSDDFAAAIAAGATMVRIGTALFGPRPGRMRRSPIPAQPNPQSDRESQL